MPALTEHLRRVLLDRTMSKVVKTLHQTTNLFTNECFFYTSQFSQILFFMTPKMIFGWKSTFFRFIEPILQTRAESSCRICNNFFLLPLALFTYGAKYLPVAFNLIHFSILITDQGSLRQRKVLEKFPRQSHCIL